MLSFCDTFFVSLRLQKKIFVRIAWTRQCEVTAAVLVGEPERTTEYLTQPFGCISGVVRRRHVSHLLYAQAQ